MMGGEYAATSMYTLWLLSLTRIGLMAGHLTKHMLPCYSLVYILKAVVMNGGEFSSS